MLRIREIRRARDMTLEALSERSGLDVAFLSRIERGERWPSGESFEAIAKALGVRVHELFASYGPESLQDREFRLIFSTLPEAAKNDLIRLARTMARLRRENDEN